MRLLVDTFHTLKSGVPTAIKVAKELGDKINFIGIRLDSGDIAYLSKEARRMLDEAGFTDAKIIASNDLDEQTITSLKRKAQRLTHGASERNSLLVSINLLLELFINWQLLKQKMVRLVIELSYLIMRKRSQHQVKRTFIVLSTKTGKAEGDYITLDGEDPTAEKPLKLFHPVHTYKMKFIKSFEAKDLHHTILIMANLYTNFQANVKLKLI